jgi:hypothetical protein
VWHDQSRFVGDDDRLRPIAQAEFVQDSADVCLHRLLADHPAALAAPTRAPSAPTCWDRRAGCGQARRSSKTSNAIVPEAARAASCASLAIRQSERDEPIFMKCARWAAWERSWSYPGGLAIRMRPCSMPFYLLGDVLRVPSSGSTQPVSCRNTCTISCSEVVLGTSSGGQQSNRRKSATPPRRVGSSARDSCHAQSEARRILEAVTPQEHPFSNGEVFEKLGIPEVPGKVDTESSVEVTMSRSPCRTMVDVRTLHGPLKLLPVFSAWIETSSRVPLSFTPQTTGLCMTESNPPPRIAGPGST